MLGHSATASSAAGFMSDWAPRRQVPSAVRSTLAFASWRRTATAEGAKPEKIGM
jgi:hypothetical protein